MADRLLSRAVVCLLVGVTFGGCTVLTKSQVKAVGQFAQATKQYDELPGGALRAYADAALPARLLEVSARKIEDQEDAQASWAMIERAGATDAAIQGAAARADDALNILGRYSDLVTELASDEFTDELDESSRSLGGALDKAVTFHNSTFGTNMNTSISSAAAAAVRGIGGIYIRARQAKLLKEYVTLFDDNVATLGADILKLLELTSFPADDHGCGRPAPPEAPCPSERPLCARLTDLQHHYGNAVRRAKYPDAETVHLAIEGRKSASRACELSKAASDATKRYVAAHHALRENVTKRQSIATIIEELKTLQQEISAARKVYKDLEK